MMEVPDCYGRSAFDYVVSQNLFTETTTKELWRDKAALRRQRILESILYDADQLEASTDQHDYDFSTLGKALWILDDDENARFAFERTVKADNEAPLHFANCDNCVPRKLISGDRFVCRICADIDLCEQCMQDYDEGNTGRLVCRGHSFLKVPMPDHVLKDPKGSLNVDPEVLNSWLVMIREKYGKALAATTNDLSSPAPSDAADLDAMIRTMRRLGLPPMRTPLAHFNLAPVPVSTQVSRRPSWFALHRTASQISTRQQLRPESAGPEENEYAQSNSSEVPTPLGKSEHETKSRTLDQLFESARRLLARIGLYIHGPDSGPTQLDPITLVELD